MSQGVFGLVWDNSTVGLYQSTPSAVLQLDGNWHGPCQERHLERRRSRISMRILRDISMIQHAGTSAGNPGAIATLQS